MMDESRCRLRFCAFCPNLCRSAWPAAHDEAETPSALALLAVSLAEGAVADTPEVRAALARRAMAASCRSACPYGIDVPALIDALLEAARAG